MTAPDRIWAVFEPLANKNDPPWVYASATPTRGQEYVRADLADPTPLAEALAVPTDDQVASACLSYRHDFGLLDAKERAALMFQAREWLRAWQKEMPAALRAIGEGKA